MRKADLYRQKDGKIEYWAVKNGDEYVCVTLQDDDLADWTMIPGDGEIIWQKERVQKDNPFAKRQTPSWRGIRATFHVLDFDMKPGEGTRETVVTARQIHGTWDEYLTSGQITKWVKDRNSRRLLWNQEHEWHKKVNEALRDTGLHARVEVQEDQKPEIRLIECTRDMQKVLDAFGITLPEGVKVR